MATAARWRTAEDYMRLVRRELFGADEPPFADVEAAREWVETESNQAMTEEYFAALREMAAAFRRVAMYAGETWNTLPMNLSGVVTLRVGVRSRNVALPGRGRWSDHFRASDRRLARIADETERIAEYLGCPRAAATIALLVGQRPRSSVRVSQTFGTNPIGELPDTVSVINLPEDYIGLEGAAAQAVRGMLDQAAGQSPPREYKPTDRAFLQLVDEMVASGWELPKPAGHGVDSGQRKFWTEFVARWSALAAVQEGYFTDLTHWTSASKRYQRLTGTTA